MNRLLLACIPLLAAIGLGLFLLDPADPDRLVAPTQTTLAPPSDAVIHVEETFYLDQTLKSRSAMRGELRHGESLGYYTNGQLQVSEIYANGVACGSRNTWYSSGEKKSEGTLVEGEFHGLFQQWHPNGKLAYVVHYEHGKPDGRAVSYYPSGYLKAEVTMLAGLVREQQQWVDGARRPGR